MYINTTHTCKNGTSRSTCSFVVGVKNSLSGAGYMYASNHNSWKTSARRSWCNAGFRSALDSDLISAFKQFNCIVGVSNYATEGAVNQTTQDFFALPAEKEVFGAKTYSTDKEAAVLTRFTWYNTTSNRIKKQGNSGSAYEWFERGPYWYDNKGFCGVHNNGTASVYNASDPLGISPFGCV